MMEQRIFVNEMGAGIDWIADDGDLLRREYKTVWKPRRIKLRDHLVNLLISVLIAILAWL